ncbi:hypothetical protein QYE76_049551 [Lolium multiflorum]|uniref:Reverse transcriptase/retrotransposon-derived protein RNase H-like domain-containing protein n=1 Tax=Lolium multiflorum TaxID=4521 RepID=A0AAD8SN89_LOLMU|nr:hypothetical protein QYE76_049551 [Lolium multiflorum]
MKPPTTKKELQCLIGKINFVRRFISNLSGRIEPFMGLVKIKSDEEFRWGAEQQKAFDDIKEYLTKPPVLVPPQQDRPFYIYLSVADTSIASVVVQVYDGLEKVVFYLSRRMLDAETRFGQPLPGRQPGQSLVNRAVDRAGRSRAWSTGRQPGATSTTTSANHRHPLRRRQAPPPSPKHRETSPRPHHHHRIRKSIDTTHHRHTTATTAELL